MSVLFFCQWKMNWVEMAQNLEAFLIKRSVFFEGQSVVAHYTGALCLEVVPGLVLWFSGSEVILQEGLQILKGGPLFRVPLPALEHELMQGAGTVLRARHPVTTLHLLQDFPVVHA